MKRTHWLILIPVLMLVFAAFRNRFFIRSDFDPYVTVLSNTNETFIFIGRSTTGQSGSAFGILFKSLTALYPQTADEREDLIMVHLKAGQVQKSDLWDFGYSGA